MFGRLKYWRRVATRFARCPTVFFSAVASPPSKLLGLITDVLTLSSTASINLWRGRTLTAPADSTVREQSDHRAELIAIRRGSAGKRSSSCSSEM